MTARVTRRIPLSPRACFDAFCDVGRIPEWVPHVISTTIKRCHSDGRASLVAFEARTVEGARQSYTLAYAYDRAGLRVSWRTHDRPEHGVHGYAAFEAVQVGCLMTYAVGYGSEAREEFVSDDMRKTVEALADAFVAHATQAATQSGDPPS